MRKVFLFLAVLFAYSCTNYYKYPTFSKNGNPLMIVEIPAGSNLQYVYNAITNTFDVAQREGEPVKLDYLPYPGNYGFIPSTLKEKDQENSEPLEVLVVGSSISQGSILEFVPVGILKLLENGKLDHKIIGVVVESEVETIECTTLECVEEQYTGILSIISTWFENYKTGYDIDVLGWENEERALALIKKCQE